MYCNIDGEKIRVSEVRLPGVELWLCHMVAKGIYIRNAKLN
jgi:hypothetical protein